MRHGPVQRLHIWFALSGFHSKAPGLGERCRYRTKMCLCCENLEVLKGIDAVACLGQPHKRNNMVDR